MESWSSLRRAAHRTPPYWWWRGWLGPARTLQRGSTTPEL